MSTDNVVRVTFTTTRTLEVLVSNNTPALAAREALRQLEDEVGHIAEGCVEVTWRADSRGKPGSVFFEDLDQVRGATPWG